MQVEYEKLIINNLVGLTKNIEPNRNFFLLLRQNKVLELKHEQKFTVGTINYFHNIHNITILTNILYYC